MRGAGIGHVTAHLWPLRLPGQTGKAATISSLSFLFSSFLFYFIYYFFWNENRKRISASTTRFELICIRLRLHTEQADGPVNDSTRWNGRFRISKFRHLSCIWFDFHSTWSDFVNGITKFQYELFVLVA